jgi:glycosyltransferase involved in cell wall biosynthesis
VSRLLLPPDFALLQVTPRLDAGGVEQTTLDVSDAVARLSLRSLVASQGGRMEARLAQGGGTLVCLPMDAKSPISLMLNAGRLGAVARRQGVKLIHARSRAPAWSALWAAQALDLPFVTTYHGVYNARSSLKRAYNSVMAKGDLVIANSDYTRDHLLAEHGVDPDRVIAIPRGVDLARFDPKSVPASKVAALRAAWGLDPADRRPVVLLAGRLTRWKGQGLLIEATVRAKAASGAAGFILVLAGDDQGRSDYTAELNAAIAAGGLQNDVKIVGHCDDMPTAYLACDVAVAPSLSPEAFGRTAVEPQAMGRPVLAADHGAARETVVEGETGWRVAPGDAAAWAAALTTATGLPKARRLQMGAAGQARARRLYSLDAMTNATLEVYARALALPPRKGRSA